MRLLYWTIHPTGGRIAVTRETPLRVYGIGTSGPTHRPRRECRGRFRERDACVEAEQMMVEKRRDWRLRREEISREKQLMRRQERLELIQITGGPP